MRDQWDNSNKLWQNRLKAISRQINERSEGVQYTFFEAMQTIMDYIEETFEKVMIPPTPGTFKSFVSSPQLKTELNIRKCQILRRSQLQNDL